MYMYRKLPAVLFLVFFGVAVNAAYAGKVLFRDSFEADPKEGKPSATSSPHHFSNPDVKWRIHGMHVYRWDNVAHDGKKAVRLGPSPGHTMLNLAPLPVTRGDYIQAEVWAKTEKAVGRTYISLTFHAGKKALGKGILGKEIKGGTPGGPVMQIPGTLAGTTDWTLVRVRGRVPDNATHVVVNLVTWNNKTGHAWFDDLAVRRLPRDWAVGELDRNPVKPDPATLTLNDYVTVKNAHLWYKGKRLRLWGSQCNFMAESHAAIDREVAKFADCGFNLHRTLIWWNEMTDDYTPGDCSHQDRLDYAIAALRQNGCFVWMDVLNGAQIRPDRVNAIDEPATAKQWVAAMEEYLETKKGKRKKAPKYVMVRSAIFSVWDPRSEKIYHNYIKKVMAHVNKHNGLTYGTDPTIAIWELTNEQWWIMRILWGRHLKLPAFFQKGLYDKWNGWLRGKYKTHQGVAKAWGSVLEGESLDKGTILLMPLLGNTKPTDMAKAVGLNVKFEKVAYSLKDLPANRGRDVLEFLNSLLIASKQRAAAVLKSQGRKALGCRVVPVVYDTGYSGNIHSFYMHSFADAIAPATYLDMRAWSDKEPTFPFASGLKKPPLINDWLDSRRIAGKPTFVYENMIFAPQKYRAEYCYRILAWAAIQDVDVVDFHYYGHPLAFGEVKNRHTMNPLCHVRPGRCWDGVSMRIDEVLMSTAKMAGEIFKRGYLKPAPNPTTVTLGSETMWDITKMKGGKLANPAHRTVLERGFQWKFDPTQTKDTVHGPLTAKENRKPVVSPTGQIAYRWKEGVLVIDDPVVKALVGFVPENFSFSDGLKLENISVNTPKAMPFVISGERYVAFSIAAMDAKPLDKSSKILVSAMNTSFNSGFKMDLEKMAKDKAYFKGLARSITNHGKLPVLVGRVGLTIKADWLKGCSYRMVDFNENIIKKGVCEAGVLKVPNDLPVYLVEISR